MTDRVFKVDYGDGVVFTATPMDDTASWQGFTVRGTVKGIRVQLDIENAAPARVFQIIDNLVEANL